MTNKELKEKLANMPKDKYIYQRYKGEITKYRDDGEHYINCEIGLAFKKDGNLFHGKVSENLINLIEVGDFVNGYKILDIADSIYENSKRILIYKNQKERYERWIYIQEYNGKIRCQDDICEILTHELYEKNCYRVGGE